MGLGADSMRACALVGMVALGGCYVETQEERAPQSGRANGNPVVPKADDDGDPGQCRTTLSKGCFDGHVLSKKELLIDGRAFFDADDLANRFKELIAVRRGELALTADDYTLALKTPIDNASFLQGFEYYATGELARSGKVRSDGNFAINELATGTYDLRLQRAVKFTLARVETLPPADDADPAAEPATRTVTRDFCAKVYADATLDVRAGERLHETFGAFKLYVTDDTCEGGSAGSTLTL